jgi:hypothetical protein
MPDDRQRDDQPEVERGKSGRGKRHDDRAPDQHGTEIRAQHVEADDHRRDAVHLLAVEQHRQRHRRGCEHQQRKARARGRVDQQEAPGVRRAPELGDELDQRRRAVGEEQRHHHHRDADPHRERQRENQRVEADRGKIGLPRHQRWRQRDRFAPGAPPADLVQADGEERADQQKTGGQREADGTCVVARQREAHHGEHGAVEQPRCRRGTQIVPALPQPAPGRARIDRAHARPGEGAVLVCGLGHGRKFMPAQCRCGEAPRFDEGQTPRAKRRAI